MGYLLLDEAFFHPEVYKQEATYLRSVLDYWGKSGTIEILVIPTESKCYSYKSIRAVILKHIHKTGKYHYLDVDLSNSSCPVLIELNFSEQFRNVLSYVSHKSDNANFSVLLLASPNRSLNKKEDANFLFINDLFTELESNVGLLLKKGILIGERGSKSNPLPNYTLCHSYEKLRGDKISGTIKDRQSEYLRIAKEVLYRNEFEKNERVSKFNPHVAGGIYYCSRSEIYASADIEHGAIEIFDKMGKHLGEFRYDGYLNSSPDKTGRHDIKVK